MKKYFFLLLFFLFSQALAVESKIALEKAPTNIHDIASIKRGAKYFANVCMACHTLIYLRYNKLAQEAGVRYERMPINVKEWPFGVKPPDLSLAANVHSPDWIYTYLHSFYPDPSRPPGFNNLVFPDTAMAGILAPYQGTLVLIKKPEKLFSHDLQWYDVLALQKHGSMTPEQFDVMVTDIVNFLVYAAEPYQIQQQRLGLWVIGFLLIFFVLTYLLKKEYWKDVH